MSATVEIERKFLVKHPPSMDGVPHSQLRQGYIATGTTEVRLRDTDGCFTLTCKRGDGLVRREEEITIDAEQFNALWTLTEGQRIEKTRYRIPEGTLLIELDVYHGSLEPLIVAEVEFDSQEASLTFCPPSYFGTEVTEDKAYKNKNLALEGLPNG
jgi:CYTH domain-containing protein